MLHFPRQVFVFLAEFVQVLLDELFLLDQGLELGEGDGLVAQDGDELGPAEEAHLDLDEREALLGGFVLEGLEEVLLLPLLGFDDPVPAFRIILALEELRDMPLEHGDEVAHPLAEQTPLTGRQHDQGRLVGSFKVVDVEDVVRDDGRFFQLLEERLDRRRPARTDHAGDEDIVTPALDVQAGLDGLEGPFLADDLVAGLDLFARGEGDGVRRAGPPDLVGAELWEPSLGCHGRLLRLRCRGTHFILP